MYNAILLGSFPLNRAGRLAGDVVHDAVHALDRVADLGGDVAQEVGLEGVPVGRHAVAAGHRTERDHIRVRALIALHACGIGQREGGRRGWKRSSGAAEQPVLPEG